MGLAPAQCFLGVLVSFQQWPQFWYHQKVRMYVYFVYFICTCKCMCRFLLFSLKLKSTTYRQSDINRYCKTVSPLSSLVLSFPSSTSSSSHFHTLNRGSCLGSHPEILSLPSSFLVSFLKGIIVHCSIYRPVSVCVFRYHSSEIALSKRAPGAREAPDSRGCPPQH